MPRSTMVTTQAPVSVPVAGTVLIVDGWSAAAAVTRAFYVPYARAISLDDSRSVVVAMQLIVLTPNNRVVGNGGWLIVIAVYIASLKPT
jgi:hypothetical protein